MSKRKSNNPDEITTREITAVTMVLVDTSVWVDHFRVGNDDLVHLLALDLVLVHPLVMGEIACGTPPNRQETLADLERIHQTRQATIKEMMTLLEREKLFGMGCGLVDLLLLTSTLLTPGAVLWTLDKRLAALSDKFNVRYGRLPH